MLANQIGDSRPTLGSYQNEMRLANTGSAINNYTGAAQTARVLPTQPWHFPMPNNALLFLNKLRTARNYPQLTSFLAGPEQTDQFDKDDSIIDANNSFIRTNISKTTSTLQDTTGLFSNLPQIRAVPTEYLLNTGSLLHGMPQPARV